MTSFWRNFERALLGVGPSTGKNTGSGACHLLTLFGLDWVPVALCSCAFDELSLKESEEWNQDAVLRQPEPCTGSRREEMAMNPEPVCLSPSVFQPKAPGKLAPACDSGHR